MKSKLLAILISAAVAIGLWAYVITVVNPESEKTYYDIPVVLQNKNVLTERGLMLVSEEPKVTLVLKSTRTILNDLNEANINVIANVANIENPGVHNLTYTVSYPGNIPPYEVAVQSSSTDLITLKVENRIRKLIPVEIDYGGTSVPEDYIADFKNLQLDSPSVEVVGPESVMDQIDKAVIRVDLSGQTKFMAGEYEYALCNEAGEPVDAAKVTTNVEIINLSLPILRVKEVALKVEIIAGGGATEQTSTITIDPQTIQISGNDAMLENLNEIVLDTINLGEILENEVRSYSLTNFLPEGVDNLTGVDMVTVEVQFPQLLMQTFNVTNITATNVPDNLDMELITKALQVTVRGPIELVSNMTEADISVVVDFSEAQPGTAKMKAEVVIGEAFAGVGAVDTYQVSATLREREK